MQTTFQPRATQGHVYVPLRRLALYVPTPTPVAGMQAVLFVRHQHSVQPVEYVRQLHPVASRHHRRRAEAGHHPVLQGLRQVSSAAQALGQS
jgi:hypothetical protein